MAKVFAENVGLRIEAEYLRKTLLLTELRSSRVDQRLSDGRPTGFQLAGPAFSESRILDAAYALEQAIGFDGSPARA